MAQLDQERVAETVRVRRGELGLTQQQVAEAAGVDTATISSLERAERWPWARNRTRIEGALGWQPGSLEAIGRGGQPTPVERQAAQAPYTDPAERHIAETPGLSEGEVSALIEVARAIRAQGQRKTGT